VCKLFTKAIAMACFIALLLTGLLFSWVRAASVNDSTNLPRLFAWGSMFDDANTAILKENGTLWIAGSNLSGQLGDGGITSNQFDIHTKARIENVRSFSPGQHHMAVIKKDGTLWMWGDNGVGQFGTGNIETQYGYVGGPRELPVQIGTETDWSIVEAAYYHTFAIKTDGSLWSWGSFNDNGVLGNGTTNTYWGGDIYIVPAQVGTDKDWASVSTSRQHTVALKKDGGLWAWGRNSVGQIGDGSTVNRLSPVRIGEDNDWIMAEAGETYTLALKSNGTLWIWGSFSGYIHDVVKQPNQIGTYSDWTYISAGEYHAAA